MTVGITTDAVMFFDKGKLVKEMLYPEFEAILDNVIGLNEFKNQQVSAAFVRVNSSLKLTAAVLFLIDFDERGHVDKSWNIPLPHLADNAGKGPDLGAGPIKLSCRSQCSVSWHQRSLWDPDINIETETGSTTLDQLAKAAIRNRLGLAVIDEPAELDALDPALLKAVKNGRHAADISLEEAINERVNKKIQQEIKTRTSALLEEQKLRIATMKSETQDHIEKLQIRYRNQLAKITDTLNSTKHLFSEEKHKNLQLKKTLQNKADEFRKVREHFQQEIEEGKEVEQSQLLALEEKFELESKASIDTATAELKEMLDMREVELFYRDEQVSRLNDEISQLRQEKQNLIDNSGDKVLQKLVGKGITFVAYQPGVEHLTIPVRDISQYLDSPINYVAEKCSVDQELYQQWMAHYELPVCNHKLNDSAVCAKPIPKVEKPSRFIVGENDRCAEHSCAVNALSSLIRFRESS
ncbi:MAG: hypothetical protein V3T17_06950 [Pseudomonadales bacterium]